MSLGLVAYDDSDESGTEVDDEASFKSNANAVLSLHKTESIGKNSPNEINEAISDKEAESTGDTGHTSKIHLPESRMKLINTDIDVKCLTSVNKRNGPVKIVIPSLNEVCCNCKNNCI